MKKYIYFIVIIVGLFGCDQLSNVDLDEYSEGLNDNFPIATDIYTSTDFPLPARLKELEDRSQFIVTVKAQEIVELGAPDPQNAYNNTLTRVEILESHKGSLSVEEEILIAEQYYNTEEGLIFVAGYVPMEMDKEYILFLRDEFENVYTITSIGFGKFNEDKESVVKESIDLRRYSDIKEFELLSEGSEESDIYMDLRKEVFTKYSK